MIITPGPENLEMYINDLSLCAEEFKREVSAPGLMDYRMDTDIFLNHWKIFMANGLGRLFLLVDDETTRVVGALGGAFYLDPNNGRKTASEMFWFVLKPFRGQGLLLMNSFEQWGRNEGCEIFQMMTLESADPDGVGKIYERKGYSRCEIVYRKEI